MNRFESKYFNTALLMNKALLVLLEKKDFELITIKDICEKAGVNRSTFYLHYQNTLELLQECLENIINNFFAKFQAANITKLNIEKSSLEKMILINEKYLQPYLEFVKENKNVFKLAYLHPEIFQSNEIYLNFSKNIFQPILNKFGINKKDSEYMIEYYIKGTMSLIMRWVYNDCKEEITYIIDIIKRCIKPYLNEKNNS